MRGRVTVREYLETLIRDRMALEDQRYTDAKEALIHARVEIEKRLAEMNNMREQLYSQANTFVTRDQRDVLVQQINMQINMLEATLRSLIETERASMDARLKDLEGYRAVAEGRAQLANQLMILIPIAIGVIEFFIIKFVH